MSDTSNGINSSVQKIFDILSAPPFPTDEILGQAMNGEMHKVADYFYRNDFWAHGKNVRYQIVRKMLEEPASFQAPAKILEFVTSKHFDYHDFFDYLERQAPELDTIKACWTMRERAPSSEMTKVSAELLSENIRYEIVKKGGFERHPADIVGVDREEFKLSYAMAQANKMAHFIITQNALVAYVEQNAEKLPAYRGAAFLSIVKGDMDSSLWTRKMTDLREVKVESVQHGEMMRWKAIYAPKL